MKIRILLLTALLAVTLSSCSDLLTANPNVAPVVVASGSTYTLYPLITQNLDVSQSYDDDDQDLEYSWTVSSSPSGGDAVVTNATKSIATFKAEVQGAYVVNSTIIDEYGLTDSVNYSITVANDNPVARIVPDITDPDPLEVVTLDGSTSDDPNEEFEVDGLDPFTWSLIDKPAGSSWLWDGTNATSSITVSTDTDDDITFAPGNTGINANAGVGKGVYTVQLTVTDEYGATHSESLVLASDNSAPVINATLTDLYTLSGSTYTIDGSNGITNTEEDTLEYNWTIHNPSAAITIYVEGVLVTLGPDYTINTGVDSIITIAPDGAYSPDASDDFTVTLTVSDGDTSKIVTPAIMGFDLY